MTISGHSAGLDQYTHTNYKSLTLNNRLEKEAVFGGSEKGLSPSVVVSYQDITGSSQAPVTRHEDDYGISLEMEESFCSNFVCCGQYLPDLHALLQHYEDCHVRFESGIGVNGNYISSNSSNNASVNEMAIDNGQHGHAVTGVSDSTQLSHSSQSMNSNGRRKRMLAVELEECDFLTEDTHVVSAFDNTILRPITPSEQCMSSLNDSRNLKRPQSVPTGINYSRLPNLFGRPAESPIDQYRYIHSILSATVDSYDHPGQLAALSYAASSNAHNPSSASSTNTLSPGPPQYSSYYNQSHVSQPQSPSDSQLLMSEYEDSRADRPYICKVPGCGKAYKNANGLKYHEKNGHTAATENVERPHRCPVGGCGKKYKNPNGLKYHMAHAHPSHVQHLNTGSGSSIPRYANSFYTPSNADYFRPTDN